MIQNCYALDNLEHAPNCFPNDTLPLTHLDILGLPILTANSYCSLMTKLSQVKAVLLTQNYLAAVIESIAIALDHERGAVLSLNQTAEVVLLLLATPNSAYIIVSAYIGCGARIGLSKQD